MRRFNNPLDHVKIASPCSADWEQMIGTDRVRFCGACNLNVYNLSSLTKSQAESLIAQTEGRLCVRFYRRNDGSILTRDCPVGVRAFRRRLSYMAKAASAAALSFFAGLGVHRVTSEVRPTLMMGQLAVIPEPRTAPWVEVPDLTRQELMERRFEERGELSPVVIGKRHSTAAPKSRRK